MGELTESPHVLKAKDVHIGRNKKKMMFVLHTSKTHGMDRKPQVININSSEYDLNGQRKIGTIVKAQFCPFSILKTYVDMRKRRLTDNEQFFVFYNRDPVTPEIFRSTLRRVIEELGLEPMLYGTHSLRAGNAVQMVENESISVETVWKLGRWRSNAIYAYLSH